MIKFGLPLISLLLLLTTCLEEEDILVMDIATVEVNLIPPLFTRNELLIKERATIVVKAFNAQGEVLPTKTTDYYFYDGQNKLLKDPYILHSEAGEFELYAVHKIRRNLKSDLLRYKVYEPVELLTKIDLQLPPDRDSFLTKESLPLRIESFSGNGSKINIPADQFSFYDQEGNELTIEQLINLQKAGYFEVHASLNNIKSNDVTFTVYDRNELVDKIQILDYDPIVIANGSSRSTIELVFYAKGKPIDKIDYELTANGEAITTSFTTTAVGTYTIVAKTKNAASNAVNITARKDINYKLARIPVIFHLVHDGEPVGQGYNHTAGTIQKELDYMNKIFRFGYESNDHNLYNPVAVDAGMEFFLATKDPNGNLLAEPGINRVKKPSKDHSIFYEEWMHEIYWDPEYYINVWVGDPKNCCNWGTMPYVTCDAPKMEGFGCAYGVGGLQGIVLQSVGTHAILAHEMGHMFGLPHSWSAASTCDGDEDYCEDTPRFDFNRNNGPNGVGIERVTCADIPYTSDAMMDGGHHIFVTYDQRERMQYVVKYGINRGRKGVQYMNEDGKIPQHSGSRINSVNATPIIVQ